MPKIAILGSCVTRDLFEEEELRPTLAQYTSRSSLISVVAPPVPLDASAVMLESAFQRRCVVDDFGKTFFPQLAACEPDWLIIDLIDERFEVLRWADSFVTRSMAFVDAGLDALGYPSVRRLTAEAGELLDDAIRRFAARVIQLLPPERVIVHRALWLTRFRSEAGLEDFDERRAQFARRHNETLERGYDVLELAFGGAASVIALDPLTYAADADHRWGLEPYHYERAYNDAAVARLRALVTTALTAR